MTRKGKSLVRSLDGVQILSAVLNKYSEPRSDQRVVSRRAAPGSLVCDVSRVMVCAAKAWEVDWKHHLLVWCLL